MKRIAILRVAMWVVPAACLEAQRGTAPSMPSLSPPSVSVYATPVAVTVMWKPVTGAGGYTVEQATSLSGQWIALALDPRGGTQVTAPTAAFNTATGGMLYYYRVTALHPLGPRGEVPLGEPGVTIVPRVTPRLNSPLGVDSRQEGVDLRVSWSPVPYATGYFVTVGLGPQTPPIGSIEVSAPSTEARLVNVLPSSPSALQYWVSVAARYGPSGTLSALTSAKISLNAALPCWSAVPLLGPAPTVSLTSYGPTAYSIATANTQTGTALVRVERAPMGSAMWKQAGCGFNGVSDQGLTPATSYQYRITEIRSGTAGQTIVNAVTPQAPDSPVPTATVGSCTADGCQVTLNWISFAGAADYRTESSYGAYFAQLGFAGTNYGGAPSGGGPLSQPVGIVPRGTHTFTVTPLFPLMRPSSRPPGQVTVVIP